MDEDGDDAIDTRELHNADSAAPVRSTWNPVVLCGRVREAVAVGEGGVTFHMGGPEPLSRVGLAQKVRKAGGGGGAWYRI
jgi:hypothetical protein